MANLEVWDESFAQRSQQLEQQVNAVWMVAVVVQQNLDNKLRLLPMLVVNTVNFSVKLLLDKEKRGPVHF
jgi:hypothetical protein